MASGAKAIAHSATLARDYLSKCLRVSVENNEFRDR